jgi:hypothetical protein
MLRIDVQPTMCTVMGRVRMAALARPGHEISTPVQNRCRSLPPPARLQPDPLSYRGQQGNGITAARVGSSTKARGVNRPSDALL